MCSCGGSQEGAWYSDVPLDVVYCYVNTTDPAWQAQFQSHLGGPDTVGVPYPIPDVGEIYLSLASVQRYAPWVRRIYLATMGGQHLDLRFLSARLRQKVRVVDHCDFIPARVLPTFSSLAIEAFLHKIPGISEHFLALNDDFLLARALERRHVFSDTPGRLRAFMTPHASWPVMSGPPQSEFQHMYVNAGRLLSQKFGQAPRPAWHGGYLLSRTAYRVAWAVFGEHLQRTASHKLRTYLPLEEGGDVNTIALVQHTAAELGLQEVTYQYRWVGGEMGRGICVAFCQPAQQRQRQRQQERVAANASPLHREPSCWRAPSCTTLPAGTLPT